MSGRIVVGIDGSREEVERDARELVDRTIGQAPPDVQIKRVVAPGLPASTRRRPARPPEPSRTSQQVPTEGGSASDPVGDGNTG